jgi:hypothetical protein
VSASEGAGVLAMILRMVVQSDSANPRVDQTVRR